MEESGREKLSGFSRRNIWIALAIGVLLSGYLIYKSFDVGAFFEINWTGKVFLFFCLALGLMAVRHLLYMYRLWMVTGRILKFRQAFESIIMWEFASAATPSTVGGAALAMFIINREGVNLGKSTAAVMVLTFFDNLFFIVVAGVTFLIVGRQGMFAANGDCGDLLDLPILSAIGGLPYIFLIGYLFLLLVNVLIGYGIFLNPRGLKKMLIAFSRKGPFKRWKDGAAKTGNEIIITAREFKDYKIFFWLKLFVITAVAWLCRYLVVNAIFLALVHLTGMEHLEVLARNLALWVIMLIPFTPGASGLAELSFIALMCSYVPAGLAATITLFWRMITYYPYLLLGLIFMPTWLRRVYPKVEKAEVD